MRNRKRWLALALLAGVLIGLFAMPQPHPLVAQTQNLLANPGFEEPYNDGVANGWSPWYEDSGDLCNTKPSDWNFVCRPTWGPEHDYNHLGLVRNGVSQHVGAQYITWHAGVYQTVNVPPGSRVRFTVWGYSRAANEQPPAPSYTDWAPRMQVGIDPEGRGNWATGVIWSAENNVRDSWQQLSIEATAGESGKVTVFVSSQFRLVLPVAHMDSWWDDAVLEIVQPAATPTPVQPTAPPAPVMTSTPLPDGTVIHVVQPGDTLYGIAYEYGVDVDQIRQLNNLGADNLIYVGQELVIKPGQQAAEPTPTPQPTGAAPQETPQGGASEATPPPSGDLASVCVSAYNDRNGDMVMQPESEELLPNVALTLDGPNGTIGTYTTDGISEPHCFQNLQPGNYVLKQTPPPGYQATGPAEWGLVLSAGQVASLQLGYRRVEGAAVQPTGAAPTATPGGKETPAGQEDTVTRLLSVVLRVSGIIALVLALLVAGLFLASQRGKGR